MDTEKFSDRGYKALFSHPRMVEELLRSFVKEDFVDQIDFSTLRREHQSYVSDQFREKESDMVWEMQFAGRTAYLYLLLEFQSTVDRCMALRVATYILLFYQDLAKVMSPPFPFVFPVVLYNGDEPWTAPLALEELVDLPSPSLRRYLPGFRYYKIAENEFSPQSLQELGNLVAGVFQVETSDVETLVGLIPKVLDIYAREANPHLRRDFYLWIHRVLERQGILSDVALPNELEVYDMLATNIRKFKEDAIHEGLEQGRQQGLLEGVLEGERRVLQSLLSMKFGERWRHLGERVNQVNSAERLEAVIKVVANSTDLAEVEAELGTTVP